MADRSTRQGAGVLGIGAAACVVCCAPLLLAFLAAASIGTLISVALFGIAGVAVLAFAAIAYLRRRALDADQHRDEPVPVVLGRRPDA